MKIVQSASAGALLQSIRDQAAELAEQYRVTVTELKQGEQHPETFAQTDIHEYIARLKTSQAKLEAMEREIDALQRELGASDGRLGVLHSMDNIVRTLRETQQMVCETAGNFEQGDATMRYEHLRAFALKAQAAADDMDKITKFADGSTEKTGTSIE